MNGIQRTKPSKQQRNQLLDTVVTILKYKKSTIYRAIYIKFFYYVTVSYITVSTDGVISLANNVIEFIELGIFFEEYFDIKVQE